MAKVLFIQNFITEYLGLMYISSALKKKGHECAVAIGKNYRKEILPRVVEEKPDVIGISIMTFSQGWGLKIAKYLKRDFPSVKIVFGGPHPTYFHDFINEKYVDAMVVGECEDAFVELIEAFSNNKPINSIKNVHCKVNGKIYANSIRPVVRNLDELEFPDRDLYKPYFSKVGRKEEQSIITSRGCPFKCTYCYNNAVDDYYGKETKFVRTRSVKNVMKELEYIRDVIKPKRIIFQDDFFGLAGKEWLYPFLEQYAEKIKIPFVTVMRANIIAYNPDLAKLLKKAGCFQVCFGIESGNEKIRNEVIKKFLTNEDIIKAADNLHQEGIYIRTCNLLGVPGEKLENVYETIELNQKIKADFPHPYLFFPFPKTELAKMAVDQGLLEKDYSEKSNVLLHKSFHHGSVLNLENKTEIENLHELFQLAVAFPFLTPLIKKWAKYNHPRINRAIFKILLGFKFKKIYKLSWSRAITNFLR